jgi:hypothetical protein
MTRSQALLAVLKERNSDEHSKAEVFEAAEKSEGPFIHEVVADSDALDMFLSYTKHGAERYGHDPMVPLMGILAVGWAAAMKWMEVNSATTIPS